MSGGALLRSAKEWWGADVVCDLVVYYCLLSAIAKTSCAGTRSRRSLLITRFAAYRILLVGISTISMADIQIASSLKPTLLTTRRRSSQPKSLSTSSDSRSCRAAALPASHKLRSQTPFRRISLTILQRNCRRRAVLVWQKALAHQRQLPILFCGKRIYAAVIRGPSHGPTQCF